MSEKTKISVTIHKRTYTVVGKETEEHVLKVAQLVNDKMSEIHEHNKHLDSTRLAVLTAVNTMNDYIKLQEEYDELISLIEEEK